MWDVLCFFQIYEIEIYILITNIDKIVSCFKINFIKILITLTAIKYESSL